MCFSSIESIESIVVGYRYYRIRVGIDTIELVSTLLPSLLPLHPFVQGDPFKMSQTSGVAHCKRCF